MAQILVLSNHTISTLLLISSMREYCDTAMIHCHIMHASVDTSNIHTLLTEYDVILLCPQLHFAYHQYQQHTKSPIDLISLSDYGSINGKKIIMDVFARYPHLRNS